MNERREHFYEPAAGHGLAHDPLNAIIAPRPIGWISTQDSEGRPNLAPYSFFNAFNYHPPIIGFSSIGWKDTVRNVTETREFAWNLATRDLAEAMNQTCAMVGPEVSEFELAGLTPAACRLIAAPRVAEARASFECRVTQILRLESLAGGELDTWLVLGEVIGVHIDRDLIKDGAYDTAAAHPILRCGGPADYAELTADRMFQMWRPSA
jgi:flavin reductase (DIM6/NTAB) family NADH-FMN oxidoreductase RutF